MEKTTEWRPGPPLSTVCRCCLAESCYKDISTEYFWMGKREVYSEMLSETFDISISYSQSGGPNSNSRLICELCISRLRDASDFKKQVQECEKTFMQHLDLSQSVIELEIPPTPVEKEVKLEQVKKEKRHSVDDFNNDAANFPDATDFADAHDDDDDDLDDQPLTKLASKLPKKETVDILELLENNKVTVKRKSSNKLKTSPSKKSKSKEKSKTKVVKASASKTSKEAKPQKKKKEKYHPKAMARRKVTASTILANSTAYPFKLKATLLQCCFCREIFEAPHEFRSHMDFAHLNTDRTRLLKQNMTRVDISNLRCRRCFEIFNKLELLVNHLKEKHKVKIDDKHGLGLVPLKLEKDRYVCVICEKKYNSLKQLYMHSGTHYSVFICDMCGMNFESHSGLSNHKLRHHSDTKFVCVRCKQGFPTFQAKKEHIRNTNLCKPFSCKKCYERFLCWEHRQNHLVEVHGETKKEFRCSECSQVLKSRATLYLHFKSAHTEELKCPYCDKMCKSRQVLNEHQLVHTGERPFKCTVCDKTFARVKIYKRHLILHDDSKKQKCRVCCKLFVRREVLKDHVKKHHPEMYLYEFPEKKL